MRKYLKIFRDGESISTKMHQPSQGKLSRAALLFSFCKRQHHHVGRSKKAPLHQNQVKTSWLPTTWIQLPPSFVNTLVSMVNLGDKKSVSQDVRRAVREKTFPSAKFIQRGDPVVKGVVGDLMRKGLEYWEDNWKGLLGNIMKQVVMETNRKRNSVSTDLKKHLSKGESIVQNASWMHHLFYSFLIGVVLYPNNMLVVSEGDEDCPLSWENDKG
jgi:hypothetical protein